VDVTSRSQRFTHPVRRATPTVAVGAHFPMAFGDRRQRRACAIVCPTVARSDRWLVGPSRLGGSCNRSISTERSRSSTSLTPVRASATSVSPRTMRRMWLTPSFTTGGHGVHSRPLRHARAPRASAFTTSRPLQGGSNPPSIDVKRAWQAHAGRIRGRLQCRQRCMNQAITRVNRCGGDPTDSTHR